MASVTVVVPIFNEGPNIAPLVARIAAAQPDATVLFVDDSTDQTPAIIADVAREASVTVTLLHRAKPLGGLGGAVIEGLRAAGTEWCIVMDGDLQHPPEMIPVLLETALTQPVDVVVASRYLGDGRADGLAGRMRHLVSSASTLVTRAMFPARLRGCTDPMTGFFAVRPASLDLEKLQPQGFKVLLEILARQTLRVAEEPFVFGAREAGESKASFRQGARFLRQLVQLRFGKLSIFAVVGGIGALANLGIMAVLTSFGMSYVIAAIIAAELTILGNFVLLERIVFHDLREDAKPWWKRLVQSLTFNNAEAAIRIPVLALLVNTTHLGAVAASAITLVAAFVVRFVFHSQVVYAPRREAVASVPSVERAGDIEGSADRGAQG